MARILTFFFVVFQILTAQSWVHAEEPQKPLTYSQKVGRKFLRGASNAALGWIELPAGIREMGEKHGVGAAATWGVLHGAGRAIQRTAVGVFEMMTFPFGLPHNFDPLIEPEYVLSES